MINQDHPFFYLKTLFAKDDAIFSFSKYVYRTDSLFDEREYLSVSSANLTVDWVNNIINSLQPNQELALHSSVAIKKRNYHIPMIDFFIEGALTEKIIDRLKIYIPKRLMRDLVIFKSGRSFHAYSLCLISPQEWIEFMGRLLLINLPNDQQIIDTRWIGHRLVSRFSSLRWSNNTDKYLALPSKIQLLI